MGTVEIFYIGRKPVVRDPVAGTGLSWTPGQSHMVEDGAASKLLAHRDVWATTAPDNWSGAGQPVVFAADGVANNQAMLNMPLHQALAVGLVIWAPTKDDTNNFSGHKATGTPTGKWVLGDAATPTGKPANDPDNSSDTTPPDAEKPAADAPPPADPLKPATLADTLRALDAEALDARLGAMSDDEVRDLGNSMGDPERFTGRNKGQALRVAVADLLSAKG